MTYTFDHPITATSVSDPSQYHVLLASGLVALVPSLTQGSPNSVVATFANMNVFDEYVIQAFVDRNAAAATTGCAANAPPNTPPFPPNGGGRPPFSCGSDGTNTYENTPGAVPFGGNAGAFSRGFTTGPDVYMVSFNTTTNVASVFLDQRPGSQAGGVGGVNLIDAAGNVVGHPLTLSIPLFPNPGPVQVTMDVAPSVMALNPVQIQLFHPGGVFPEVVSGVGGFCELNATIGVDGCSVPHIVQQTGSGVRIKAVKQAGKRHKKHKAQIA